MTWTPRNTLALPLLLLVGCAGGGDSASRALSDSVGVSISDSLGVSIIEYDNALGTAAGPQDSTDVVPLFSVGSSAPELDQVRTAKFLSNGQFVVANGGSRELLLFDEAGQLIARAGGQGQGPGEFRELTSLSVGPGDSLFAYDVRQRRLSVFDPGVQFARSVTLSGTDGVGALTQVGVLGSGEVIGVIHKTTGTCAPVCPPPWPDVGLVRDSLIVMTFTPSGEAERRLGVFPHLYTDWGPHQDPGGGGAVVAPLPVAFSSLAEAALGATSVFVGLPENYALIRLSLDGGQRVTRQRQAPWSGLEKVDT